MPTSKRDDNRGEATGVSEQTFPSTTYEFRRVMVRRRRQAHQDSAPKALRWRRLPRRDPRKPLAMTIKWRGGPEGWVEVHARGDIARLPGYVTVAELVLMANSQGVK